MVSDLFHTFVYIPLYNALVGLLSLGAWVDVGVAVIVLTVLVKLLLYPLSLKAARTQRLMREMEAPMKEIRAKYKDDREEQGKRMLALYKEKGVNPFSGFVVLFVQLPIILGLYFVFSKGGLPGIDTSLLYPFVHGPQTVDMWFVGLVDMASKSHVLAVLAGVTQFFQAHYALTPPPPRSEHATFQEDFARSMQLQMKYVLPVMIVFIAYVVNAAVALYWITSNIFGIGQEIFVKRKLDAAQRTA